MKLGIDPARPVKLLKACSCIDKILVLVGIGESMYLLSVRK